MRIAINQISLNPLTVARILGALALLLVLASVAGQFSKFALGHGNLKGLVTLFNVDAEHNIPTHFSMLLLLFAALLLAIITVLNRQRNMPHVSKWAILACGFLFMSFDEAATVHESLVAPIRPLLGDDGELGFFYWSWVIPGIVLVLLLGVFFRRFLLDLPYKVRLRFLIAAVIYIGGAIGFELIGGRYIELHGDQNLMVSMIATIEESLEMAGLIYFIWALLQYCADNYQDVWFRFES
jgi:hypothetical protein